MKNIQQKIKIMKVKTDHPFTVPQLKALNKELSKISEVQIVSTKKGLKMPALKNYSDIEILHTPFSLDVFLSYMDVHDADRPKSQMLKIDITGKVDEHTRINLEFNSLADRVTFFNSLTPIEFL